MKLRIAFDAHTHTKFSIDASDDMADMCRAAIKKGFKHICFTEHLDMNPADYGCGFFNLDAFSEAIDMAREEFGDSIGILKGLEFSEPHLYPEKFEEISNGDFDIILGSVHFVGQDFVGESKLRNRYSVERIFELYYEEVLKAVEYGGFDVLAHMDFPKRYHKESCICQCVLQEILDKMVSRQIALEINSSPLRKGLLEASPDRIILEKYIQAGGRKITIGSDAHSCGEIGSDFGYVERLLGEFGSLELGIFEKRQFKNI